MDDPTNESDIFLRNALRLKVLPALKLCDNRFDKNFEKTHTHIQETDAFIARLVDKTFQEITVTTDGYLWLDTTKFLNVDPFLHHSVLLKWLCRSQVPFTPSTPFFDELLRFLKNPGAHHQIQKSWRIEKKENNARIAKILDQI